MIELLKTSRVILYYNGAISALTLFVQHPDESVCYPLPFTRLVFCSGRRCNTSEHRPHGSR